MKTPIFEFSSHTHKFVTILDNYSFHSTDIWFFNQTIFTCGFLLLDETYFILNHFHFPQKKRTAKLTDHFEKMSYLKNEEGLVLAHNLVLDIKLGSESQSASKTHVASGKVYFHFLVTKEIYV